MRNGGWLAVVGLVVACERRHEPPAAPMPAPIAAPVIAAAAHDAASAAPAASLVVDASITPDAALGVGDVELLHAVPAIVAVSSVVVNAGIHPADLVDGDLETAWNSRTGDLASAWIAVRVPAAARITKLRMTAGFTAIRADGDYFTQNHRVRTVHVVRTGPGPSTDFGVHELHVDDRGLQTIDFDAPGIAGGDVRIELTALVPGSKPSYREACVSELEVWGTAPAAAPGTRSPTIAIGSLDAAPAPERTLELKELPYAASLEAYCQANVSVARPAHDPAVACGTKSSGPDLADAPAPWSAAEYVVMPPLVDFTDDCGAAITSPDRDAHGRYVVAGLGDSCGDTRGGWCALTRAGVVLDKRDAQHFVWLTTKPGAYSEVVGTYSAEEYARVCGTTHDGKLGCTDPILVGEQTSCRFGGEGPPGADGLVIHSEQWSFEAALSRGVLRITRGAGWGSAKPDADQRAVLGRYRVVY